MNSFINFSLKDIRNLHAGPERQNCSCERSRDTERRENGWRVVGCELPGSLEDGANVHLHTQILLLEMHGCGDSHDRHLEVQRSILVRKHFGLVLRTQQ